MGKRDKKPTEEKILFDPQEAYDQAVDTLYEAQQAQDIFGALVRIVWINRKKKAFPQSARPTNNELIDFIQDVTDNDLDQIVASLDRLARWFYRDVRDNLSVMAGWIIPREVVPLNTLMIYILNRFFP